MSDFICINDRNQLPKYIPGYDTPEKAEAASLAMSANDVVYLEGSGGDIGGPGSYVKTITLIPTNASIGGNVTLNLINGQSMILWPTATYAEIPPPVTLNIGAINSGVSVCSMGLGSTSVKAIVTGYFTPVT